MSSVLPGSTVSGSAICRGIRMPGEAPFGKVTAHLPFRSAERQYPVLACRDFQMNSATEIKGGFAVFFCGAVLPMSGIRGGRHALFRTESASCRDFRTESRIRTRRIVFRDFRPKAKMFHMEPFPSALSCSGTANSGFISHKCRFCRCKRKRPWGSGTDFVPRGTSRPGLFDGYE